jgi:hypothetical protein
MKSHLTTAPQKSAQPGWVGTFFRSTTHTPSSLGHGGGWLTSPEAVSPFSLNPGSDEPPSTGMGAPPALPPSWAAHASPSELAQPVLPGVVVPPPDVATPPPGQVKSHFCHALQPASVLHTLSLGTHTPAWHASPAVGHALS